MVGDTSVELDLESLALEVVVYLKGTRPPALPMPPFKVAHDFSLFATRSVGEALTVALAGAAAGCSVGVAAGDMLVEGDDRFGTPVVVAARLAGVAGPGRVLCERLVIDLAEDTGFAPAAEYALKGLREPVLAAEPSPG